MKIAIGSDRRGFDCKEKLIRHLISKGYSVADVGPYSDKLPVDYPIYGEKVGNLVITQSCTFGVVICATGIGIMMAANKIKGIRCGIAYSDDVARLMREHNDANVIAFGQDFMNYKDIQKRLDIFLNTDFAGGYHRERVKQMENLENGFPIEQSPFINKIFSETIKDNERGI